MEGKKRLELLKRVMNITLIIHIHFFSFWSYEFEINQRKKKHLLSKQIKLSNQPKKKRR